jgi:hypothetical protein
MPDDRFPSLLSSLSLDDGPSTSGFSSPVFLCAEAKGPNWSSCLCDRHIIYVLFLGFKLVLILIKG